MFEKKFSREGRQGNIQGKLLFPPSLMITSAAVNCYRSAEGIKNDDVKNAVSSNSEKAKKTDAELAADLRHWSVENKL